MMNEPMNETSSDKQEDTDYADHIEEFAGGEVSARHGRINRWLMVVYGVLFVWAIYYGITYWGGLGPGLDY